MLRRSPAEIGYVRAVSAETPLGDTSPPGVTRDDWTALSDVERARRLRWINRYGATPLALLRLPVQAVELSGLRVVEWDLPPGCSACSLPTTGEP
ncbi:hypothetical protein ACFVT9_09905 [Kitasatospora cineracea]|uniref:hypothetical protein n=1 Tax=Kitasatospora cineracea TaxID=88074 RepID=UPI0033FD57A2